MPRISSEAKAQNRAAIVEAAGRRFRRDGIDGVGLATLMKDAGLTHGGFYNHFASKDELAREVIRSTFDESHALYDGLASADVTSMVAFLDRYLSAGHRDEEDGGCPSAALAADSGRHDAAIQEVFAQGLEGFLGRFEEAFRADAGEGADDDARRLAVGALAQMVGAVVLARAVHEARPRLSDEVLAAARATVAIPGVAG